MAIRGRPCRRIAVVILSCTAAFGLTACGGGGSTSGSATGSGSGSAAATYSISAKITGLTANGLSMDANGSDISISGGATSATLTSGLADSTAFTVSVATQPSGEDCAVTNGSGTISSANVTDVSVNCGYTVSGTITGLGAATGLSLLANGAYATPVAANSTTFTIDSSFASGTAYDVTAGADPVGLLCMLSHNTGTISSAGVAGVEVNCGAPAEKVLYSFQGIQSSAGIADGEFPAGSLAPGGTGMYYGTTYLGGPDDSSSGGNGTLFEYDVGTNTEKILYGFPTGTDLPIDPAGSLIQASDGNYYGLASGGTDNAGVIYRFDPSTDTVSTVYTFTDGADGGNPENELIQAADGNLYGIASSGGEYGYGVIFSYNLSTAQESVLYSFQGSTDGDPSSAGPGGGPLLQASDGNLYGTAGMGGSASCGCGVLFEYNLKTDTYSVLHTFTGGTDGAFPQGNLIQDAGGNIYGETTSGGDSSCVFPGMQPGCGTIFEYDPGTKQESVVHVFGSVSGDGLYPNTGMMIASDGNFYGMTGNGGSTTDVAPSYPGDGTVFQFNPTSGQETVLHSFSGPPDGTFSEGEGDLVQMSTGDLIGLTTGGGAAPAPNGTIFELYLK